VVTWPDHVDEILGGDLTAALGYATPAGGAVVMAVAPIGLRDRRRGTVSFTTSLGFALLFFNGLQAKQGMRQEGKLPG
jgi:hypothetical protein